VASKGLEYAEVTLGVNSVYEEAQAARQRVQLTQNELSSLRAAKRISEGHMADREMTLVADHRGNHADMSQAAFDRHIKVVLHQDSEMTGLRDNISRLDLNIDQTQGDLRIAEIDVKIDVARMEELAGYLTYLAALKTTEPAKTAKTAKEST
jgi:hypothetical protein